VGDWYGGGGGGGGVGLVRDRRLYQPGLVGGGIERLGMLFWENRPEEKEAPKGSVVFRRGVQDPSNVRTSILMQLMF
jgi:hypothetical protein